jgi:hypothetical protein
MLVIKTACHEWADGRLFTHATRVNPGLFLTLVRFPTARILSSPAAIVHMRSISTCKYVMTIFHDK